MRRLMPRHGLEQLTRAGHRERQDEPVRLRQGQCVLDGRDNGALVAEFTVRECRQEVRVHDGHVADGRGRPVQDTSQRGESGGRIALGKGDGRAGINDLAAAGQFGVEVRQRGPGLAELPEAGLGGQPEAGDLGRQRV